MKAGNEEYKAGSQLPHSIPLFPLEGALLLPGGNLPLNIFEPRYLAMIDDAFAGDRLVGMIQPDLTGAQCDEGPLLCQMGCIGRLTGYQESGDGRYLINLTGICRFTLIEEIVGMNGYRRANIRPIDTDLQSQEIESKIDRNTLIATFRRYLESIQMETDWQGVEKTDDVTLVTTLCMMSPYGAAEKQELLEAKDLVTRAQTLVALTEMALARYASNPTGRLQ